MAACVTRRLLAPPDSSIALRKNLRIGHLI